MSKLVGKQAADLLIPRLPASMPGHPGVPCIDEDIIVVGAGQFRLLGLPNNANLDPAPVAVPPRLCGSDIGKMRGQNARGEKLAIRNF